MYGTNCQVVVKLAMEVLWFSDDISADSIPLCRDYLRNGGKVGTETTVRTVIKNGTGLLLVGDYFKGVVFSNKLVYRQLLEALALYVANPEQSALLVIKALETGYIKVGAANFGEGGHYWVSEGSNFRLLDKAASTEPTRNPFIQQPETPTVPYGEPSPQKNKGEKKL